MVQSADPRVRRCASSSKPTDLRLPARSTKGCCGGCAISAVSSRGVRSSIQRQPTKWGMAWSHDTRKAAVASAQTSCGNSVKCAVEISFFGTQCGVFAHSGSNWAIVARDNIEKARADALSNCQKLSKACRIIASVCADGAGRASATD